jgi:3'-phosphoadenosine 5'-phosphosulfate sulfotransferase (PAPS reductase)/FAD synthetase
VIYGLDVGRCVVSLSGGTGSFASACLAHEAGLDFRMVFADTLIEDEDLYRLLDDIEGSLGREIVRLQDGRTPWQVFHDRKFIGNSKTAHCSQILKRDVIRRWLDANEPDATLILGMGLDEPERMERAVRQWAPRKVASLLAMVGWSRQDAEDCYRRYGIKRPRLYGMGFLHNNCGGFCVRGGQGAFAHLLRHFPERFAWHEGQEAAALAAIEGAKPILRDRCGGSTKGMTMARFREIEASTADLFDWGACGCFSSGDAA